MRGVSLPQEPVFSLLKTKFVVGWKNIIKQRYVGESHGYTCDGIAVGTTNGAGPHNVQTFVISTDGVVLHALPGFWHPEDLARELRFALVLREVWRDQTLDRATKDTLFTALQLAEIGKHPRAHTARSGWQGFDAKNEMKRLEKGVQRDTFVRDQAGQVQRCRKGRPRLKSTNVIAHERMASRPFVPFARFDVAVFADYGRTYYDNNKKVNGVGVTFVTPRKADKLMRRWVQTELRRQQRIDKMAARRERLRKRREASGSKG